MKSKQIVVKDCKITGSVPMEIQYIPRNMHTVFALLCFVVVIHWLIFPYPSGLLHWHCGNLTIAPVPAKQPWWIWINTSCEFIMNDCITTTKQSTTKPCAYFLGYTVLAKSHALSMWWELMDVISVISEATFVIFSNFPIYKIYFISTESHLPGTTAAKLQQHHPYMHVISCNEMTAMEVNYQLSIIHCQ